MSIAQIRHLQKEHPSQPFALELSSGGIIQIYDPGQVATNENELGSIGVLHGNGVFEVFPAKSVVSVSVGVHPVVVERVRKTRENMEKRFGLSEDAIDK